MSNVPSASQKRIDNLIFTVRGVQVMVDYHLAELYEVETKRVNEQVKRNIKRFPEHFMFQLSRVEWEHLQSQIATAEKQNGLQSQIATAKRRALPYVFSEQGVAMLSAILNSDAAIRVSIRIMDAFVKMRHLFLDNALMMRRLENIEVKQVQADRKFEQIFKALERKEVIPSQGIFFEGQVFDAYAFVSKIIRSAKQSIILIDNYINESVFTHLAKKKKGVRAVILTASSDTQVMLDLQKANQQYGDFTLKIFARSHDRFLIIDNQDVYHLGASLKDLGKKWFAFSKMDKNSVSNIVTSISGLI